VESQKLHRSTVPLSSRRGRNNGVDSPSSQMAVEGGTADFDDGRNGAEGVFSAVVELAGDGQLVGGHGARTAPDAAASPGGGESRRGALADQGGLEFGQGAEDVEDQATGRGGGVDAFSEGAEPDLAGREVGDGGDEMAQVPPEPVESPHDERVTGPKMIEHPVELRALLERAAGLVRPHPNAPGGLKGVGLQVRLLLDGADSGVAEEVSHPASVSKTVGEGVDATLFSDTVYGTAPSAGSERHHRVVKYGRFLTIRRFESAVLYSHSCGPPAAASQHIVVSRVPDDQSGGDFNEMKLLVVIEFANGGAGAIDWGDGRGGPLSLNW
jgi:hypothetical protein